MSERCTWCGAAVERDEGFRAYEPAGGRRAVFCRLEHVVPWAIRGAYWEPADPEPPSAAGACARCGEPLGEAHVLLVRHRGEHRVADAFCSVEHLTEWAKQGGRWA